MAVTRTKKSSITSGTKYSKTLAGNFGYPWADATWPYLSGATGSQSGLTAKDYVSFMEASSGQIQGSYYMGPNPLTSIDGGKTWQNRGPISYGTGVGGFNGAFVGGGNYMTSSAAYTNDVNLGWTYITGLYGVSSGYNFAPGGGGFTSAGVPVWVIPYTYSNVHYAANIAGTPGIMGVPSATWTNGTVVNAVAGSGSQSKIAVANDTLVYAGYSNTTPSTGTFFIRYAPINASTGVVGSFSTGSLTITGLMRSLQTVNGKFIISTADNKIYTSTDGLNWTTQTSPFTGSNPLYIAPASCGTVFAMSDVSAISHVPYSSSDGINWSAMFSIVPSAPTSYSIGTLGSSPSGMRWVSFTSGGVYRNQNVGI